MSNAPELLLVDDDATFARVMARSLGKRRFHVTQAADVDQGLLAAREQTPAYALIDLNMPNGSGLQLIKPLLEINADMQIVVLTGYASIATAVEAIKLGALHYLTKPADADDVCNAFAQETDDLENDRANDQAGAAEDGPIPLNRVEWEHIQRVLHECNGNISQTARRLGMHRRTLQRKLQKRPSR